MGSTSLGLPPTHRAETQIRRTRISRRLGMRNRQTWTARMLDITTGTRQNQRARANENQRNVRSGSARQA